jgi:hypothetical protein
MMRVCAYVRKQHVREALCWDGDLPIVYVCVRTKHIALMSGEHMKLDMQIPLSRKYNKKFKLMMIPGCSFKLV